MSRWGRISPSRFRPRSRSSTTRAPRPSLGTFNGQAQGSTIVVSGTTDRRSRSATTAVQTATPSCLTEVDPSTTMVTANPRPRFMGSPSISRRPSAGRPVHPTPTGTVDLLYQRTDHAAGDRAARAAALPLSTPRRCRSSERPIRSPSSTWATAITAAAPRNLGADHDLSGLGERVSMAAFPVSPSPASRSPLRQRSPRPARARARRPDPSTSTMTVARHLGSGTL